MQGVVRGIRRIVRWFLLANGPLRRGTDRVEMAARLFLLLAVVSAAPAGLLTGFAVYRHDAAVAARQAATRHEVHAAVLTAPQVPDSTTGDAAPRATVAWTGADGKQRTATVAVDPAVQPEDRVAVWLTADGRVTGPPRALSDVRAEAAWTGILVGLGAVLVGSAVLSLVGKVLDRWRFRQWESAWVAVEPVWTSRRR